MIIIIFHKEIENKPPFSFDFSDNARRTVLLASGLMFEVFLEEYKFGLGLGFGRLLRYFYIGPDQLPLLGLCEAAGRNCYNGREQRSI